MTINMAPTAVSYAQDGVCTLARLLSRDDVSPAGSMSPGMIVFAIVLPVVAVVAAIAVCVYDIVSSSSIES